MADQHNDNIPSAGNVILADVEDIKENLEWHKDCFQHCFNGFANATAAALGHVSTVWIPATQMITMTDNGASYSNTMYGAQTGATGIQMPFFAFDGASEEFVCFDVVLPEGWGRGTVKAKFYWSSDTGSTIGDTVEWSIRAFSFSNSQLVANTYGAAVSISDALEGDNGSNMQVTSATAAVTVGGTAALNDMINFKVSRNVGGTDDMTENAWLFGVLIQFTQTFPDASGTNAVAAW